MSAILKKIERKVGHAQDEQKSSSLIEMLGEIRAEIKLSNMEKDVSRDERLSFLENLLLRTLDGIEQSEKSRIAKEEQESLAKEEREAKLQADLAASNLKCETLERQNEALHAVNLSESRIAGDERTERVRFEVMYEAEKRARIVAETASAQDKIEHERQMQMMSKPEGEVGVNQAGWKLTPHRDAADNLLYMTVDLLQ